MMQGPKNSSTPDASPKSFALKIVFAMPVNGNKARPASDERRATAGTAKKNGVERNVKNDGQMLSLTAHKIVSGKNG